MKLRYLLFIYTLLLPGCASVPHELTAEGGKVRTITGDPPSDCKELSTVTGTSGMVMPSSAKAKNQLRNKAAAAGGNVVRIDSVNEQNFNYTGTVFLCP